jgi:hypothetical protein
LKEHHAAEAVKQGEAEERREQHGKNDDQAKEKWGKGDDEASDATEMRQGANFQGMNNNASNTSGNLSRGPPGNQYHIPCEHCGFYNHLSKDCRRLNCEICGLGNHVTYNCRMCIPWNSAPELCATQVEDQSFLFIEENIDPRVAKEKESFAIITIVEGEATCKQIEQEFTNLMGSETWKWKARLVGDKKFVMRFPSAKIINQWCHFKFLPVECAEAQMKVEAWTPCLGAKGMLQMAWFRVHDIPSDQRFIRTIAKVGGLVEKVMEIDESTRFRHDYVRMRIACQDVTKVPRTAQSTLGLFIHEFTYEREVEVEENEKMFKGGIRVSSNDQQPKSKDDDKSALGSNSK